MFDKNTIHIIDDFLPESYVNAIQKQLIGPDIYWHFMRDITHDNETIDEFNLNEVNPAFAHKMFDSSTGPVSSGFGFTLPILYFACDKLKIGVKEVLNTRSFMTIPLNHTRLDHPHIDQYFEHTVCLYYVSDSDGDTVIYKEQFPHFPADEASNENLTVWQTVTPKKGRAIIFDGSYYHCSSRPSKGVRQIINFNFLMN